MGKAGKALRQVLKTYGISQNQLAIAMGINPTNVSLWVSESRDPSAEAAVFYIVKGKEIIDCICARLMIVAGLCQLIWEPKKFHQPRYYKFFDNLGLLMKKLKSYWSSK